MRLYDRIRIVADLPDMPVIDGSAIARQIDSLPDLPEGTHLPASFYGIVAPPFEHFWVESTTYKNGGMIQRGCSFALLEDDLARQINDHAQEQNNSLAPTEWRWCLGMMAFQYEPHIGLMACAGNLYLWLDQKGRVIMKQDGVVHVRDQVWGFQENPAFILLQSVKAANFVPFSLKTVNALHQRVEAEHITPTRQMRRQHERQNPNAKPLTDYYVLKVAPTEIKTLEDAKNIGKPTEEPTTKREHSVRGHFRYYSPEKPMLGRPGAHGAFWIPKHTRGDDTIGKIKKDYEV